MQYEWNSFETDSKRKATSTECKMLVLTRKTNQEIIIGENVKITVLKVKGNTVRLGIEAPREVRVVRGELPKHEEPKTEMAEVTIVFSDSKDKPVSDESLRIVPFSKRSRVSESNDQAKPPRMSSTAPSIQPLPENLSNNRLKQILAELSGQ